MNLSDPWPWADSSVEEVLALDVFEHIGDGYRLKKTFAWLPALSPFENMRQVLTDVELVPFNGRIHCMNELHRVLKPGGRATIELPNAAKGVGFQHIHTPHAVVRVNLSLLPARVIRSHAACGGVRHHGGL